jgi:hypothetical protein
MTLRIMAYCLPANPCQANPTLRSISLKSYHLLNYTAAAHIPPLPPSGNRVIVEWQAGGVTRGEYLHNQTGKEAGQRSQAPDSSSTLGPKHHPEGPGEMEQYYCHWLRPPARHADHDAHRTFRSLDRMLPTPARPIIVSSIAPGTGTTEVGWPLKLTS